MVRSIPVVMIVFILHAGMVFAENQALRWIADLAGMPDSAGGCFATGGTMANLSALVAARHDANAKRTAVGLDRPARWAMVAAESAHSSVDSAARVMDVDVLLARVDGDRRLRGDAVAEAIAGRPDGTEVNRDVRRFDGSRVEEGLHARELVVLAFEGQRAALLPTAKDGAQRIHVLAHARDRRCPRQEPHLA